MRKSQASFEFFFMLGTVIFFFLIVAWVVIERREATQQTTDFLGKKDLCTKLASSISSVYSGGDGTTLKIPNIRYGINITPSYRTISVYDLHNKKDFAECSVPVEKILFYNPEAGYNGSVAKYQSTLKGFGSAEYSFRIENSTIQLRDIEDRVFISTNCSLNEADYAEGMTTQGDSRLVTNPLKRLDGNTLNLVATGVGSLPGEYLLNIAYTKLGQPYCLLPVLEELGYLGANECVEYSDPQCNDPKGACNIFKSTSVIQRCLFDPDHPSFTNWYSMFLYEDVQNLDATQLGVLEDRISRSAWALLSGGILKADQGYVLGAYVYDEYGTGLAQHVGDDSEGLLELTNPSVDYSGKVGSVRNPGNLADFEPLYEFISYPGYYAIARWKYPDQATLHGNLYYFTDYCIVSDAIKELVQKVMSIEYYNWVSMEFRLARRVGETVPAQNPISIYVAHEINDINYQDKTAWISRIEWCNLDKGCPSWNLVEVGEVTTVCQNHVSAYNNKTIAKCRINLLDQKVENIGLKIKFSAPSGSGMVPINVDFIQVETCY